MTTRKPKLQIVGSPSRDAKVINEAGDVLFEEVGPDAWRNAQAFYRANARLTAQDRRDFAALDRK